MAPYDTFDNLDFEWTEYAVTIILINIMFVISVAATEFILNWYVKKFGPCMWGRYQENDEHG